MMGKTPMRLAIFVLVAANVVTLVLLREKALCGVNYPFINPRYRCDKTDIVNKKGYTELKSRLNAFIDQKKREGKAEAVGVWFRDLEAGPTFGINDRMDFIPASLLKLPLAITFFELAADNPDILQRTVTYSGTIAQVPTQVFKPQDPLQKNATYTIDQLIAHALTHSDNVAAQLLYEYLKKNYKDAEPLSQTYRDLGILEPGSNLDMDAVNTKEYGSIFRLLYNASFLGKDDSEKLLALLVESDFQDGLRKGVPQQIVVVHKFGERFSENGKKQLHDCGIVYYPGNPYQLCVMTKGDNYDNLKEVIAEISRQVYQEFDSRNISR